MKAKLLIYIFFYLLALSMSLGVLRFFMPYFYVENNTSRIICANGSGFDSGPNLIFALSGRLDSFNDAKARKLCEYNIIRDYINSYKSPDKINYQFKPDFVQESSLINAFLAASLFFVCTAVMIEMIKKIFLRSSLPLNLGKRITELLVYFIS